MTQEMRVTLLQEINELQEKAEAAWQELNAVEKEIAPHVQRRNEALDKWCEINSKLTGLKAVCQN